MRLTLISPRLALQKADYLGSGVPYWPIELATLAAYARESGDDVNLIDLFGNNPNLLEDAGDHYLQGQRIEGYLSSSSMVGAEIIILYAISYMAHEELLSIIRKLRSCFLKTPIAVLENSQAVTGYSLPKMAESLFKAGCSHLICGEPWFNWPEIKSGIVSDENYCPGNVMKACGSVMPVRLTNKNFRYPTPAWDLINLHGYWSLPYSHGPKTPTYFPILTSRGCPYPCNFCVIPETNDRKWRSRSPEDVVSEIIELRDAYNVYDFQIEDVNPTIRYERWERICQLLIEKNVRIRFYFVSGTKAETIRIDKVPLYAKAGCRYISISPESGSNSLMKAIGKKFNYEHGLELVRACRYNNIRTQACFLVGHPDEGEGGADFNSSQAYLRALVRCGLDEVAIFVVASFAGSALYERDAIFFKNDKLIPSFSPKGRANYCELDRQRKLLIRTFFIEKIKKGSDLWFQAARALFGTPQTKMENLPKRIFFVMRLIQVLTLQQKKP